MHFNYYFLKHLSAELDKLLPGFQVISCFSQNRNELIIEFGKSEKQFYIKALLDGPISLLTFPNDFSRARKNSVDLFPEIKDGKVTNLVQIQNDRSFLIKFENGYSLIFKLHGRLANIVLHKEGHSNKLFKSSLTTDQDITPESLAKHIDQGEENVLESNFDLKSLFPTFNKDIYNHLADQGFHDSEKPVKKLTILNQVLKELEEPPFYVSSSQPKLTLLAKGSDGFNTYAKPIEAANAFGLAFHKDYFLGLEKRMALSQINDHIKKSNNYLKKTNTKLKELEESRSYSELADILMANLHAVTDENQRQVGLLDFYKNENISIKINPKLTLQKNAENYYRKAKNQSVEIQTLERNIRSKQEDLEAMISLKEQIAQAQDIKSVRAMALPLNSKKKSSQEPTTLFYEMEVDGYQILIGRNAKNNDLLTQRHAHKNDLWLHAKDVPGSHVLIKNQGNDKFPKPLIEKVAQLAAWYSKRKNDTLCPVIFTPKKYVTKPKGFAPGMVRLLREEVILVKPSKEVKVS